MSGYNRNLNRKKQEKNVLTYGEELYKEFPHVYQIEKENEHSNWLKSLDEMGKRVEDMTKMIKQWIELTFDEKLNFSRECTPKTNCRVIKNGFSRHEMSPAGSNQRKCLKIVKCLRH
ncbi:hypothetical protein JTB14_033686 [Gonioctena quinquepunctata]|nr:hypothetical protein JTB14_033686 [Gonioctena quinquepunctata]